MKPGWIIFNERIVTLSEIKEKEIKIRTVLSNWKLVVLICISFYTAKIAAEQLAMYNVRRSYEQGRD